MVANWAGPPAMLAIFRKFFGSFAAPHIIKQNNFQNFQHYFIQKTIPLAMAGLRYNFSLFELLRYCDLKIVEMPMEFVLLKLYDFCWTYSNTMTIPKIDFLIITTGLL